MSAKTRTREETDVMLIVKNLRMRKTQKELVTVPASATVADALEKMRENNIRAVLVMSGEKLLGIYTETDYARKGEVAGRSALTKIVEVMTAVDVKTVTDFANLRDCAEAMAHGHFNHLVVVEGDRPVDVISSTDLVLALAEDLGHIHQELFGLDSQRT